MFESSINIKQKKATDSVRISCLFCDTFSGILEESMNSISFYFCRINIFIGVPLSDQRSRILFSKKRL